MTEIYIDEEIIELSDNSQVAMSYQINNVGDIKNQKTNFSTRISIPGTKDNLRKLGLVTEAGSIDARPYRRLKCRIRQNGEDIIEDGLLTIISTVNNIEVVIFSGLINFYSLVEGKSLGDLDLTEHDHVLNVANVDFLASKLDGICYPLINYGNLDRDYRLIDINNMFFSIYVKEIFDKIQAEHDITFEGSFIDHPYYPKMIIPFDGGAYKADKDTEENIGVEASGSLNIPPGEDQEVVIVDDANYIELNNANGNFNRATGQYTFSEHVRGTFKVNGNLNLGGTGEVFEMRLSSLAKGDISDIITDEGEFGVIEFSLDSVECAFYPGEVVSIIIDLPNGGVTGDIIFEFQPSEFVSPGGIVKVSQNMPDISQKDFIKDICAMFGVLVDEDLNAKKVYFNLFDDIDKNRMQARDWSDKLDVGKTIKTSFEIGLSRRNDFLYNNDDTLLNPDYGNSFIIIDDENLDEESPAVELNFGATEEAKPTKRGVNKFLPVIRTLEQEEDFSAPLVYVPATSYNAGQRVLKSGILFAVTTSNAEEPSASNDKYSAIDISEGYEFRSSTKVNTRILISDLDVFVNFKVKDLIEDNEEETVTSAVIPFFDRTDVNGDRDSLSFDYLIENNYKVYNQIFDRTKVINAYFNLTPEDVNEKLDFMIPVFVGKFSNYFYINKINQFIKDKSTQVELVRI